MAGPDPNPDPDAADGTESPPARVRPARTGLVRWTIGGVAGLLGLVALLCVGALALLSTEPGTRWLVQRIPGLAVEGLAGAVAGPDFSARRLVLSLPSGLRIEVEDLRLRGLRWQGLPYPGAWAALHADTLAAARVHLQPGTSVVTGAPVAPSSLRLPLSLVADAVAIDAVQWADQPPLTGLRGSLRLGDDLGARHGLALSALTVGPVQASGQLRIGADAPLTVQSQVDLVAAIPAPVAAASAPPTADAGAPPTPWQAQVRAQGPLADLVVQARLRATASAPPPAARAQAPASGAPPATLDLQTRVRPFAAWPLAQLALTAEAVDLAALLPGAPRTALGGRATLDTGGLDAPAKLEVALQNGAPGRLDEGRLPLRGVTLQATAVPSRRDTVELGTFELILADRGGATGRISGSGRWDAQGLALQTRWLGVQAARVDARAALVRVDGRVDVDATGLPAPNQLGGASPAAVLSAAAWSWQVDLQGAPTAARGAATPPRLSLQANGRLREGVVELPRLLAQAGAARLEATLTIGLPAAPAGSAPRRLSLQTTGSVRAFDPGVWWAGPAAAPWTVGAQRVNAEWTARLGLPWPWSGPAAAWRAASGVAELKISNSLWAGLPWEAEARLGAGAGAAGGAAAAPGAPPGRSADLRLTARAGDNTLELTATAPGADRLDLRAALALEAPKPAQLAAWVAPWPALAAAWPRAGEARVRATASGRWPAMASTGELQAKGLASSTASLADAQARWQVSSSPDAPLAVTVQLKELRRGTWRVPQVDAQIEGTARQHRAQWSADAPLVPPAWLARALGRDTAGGVRLGGRAEGSWLSPADRLWPAQGWRGRLQALQMADLPGSGRSVASPWLVLRSGADTGPATADGSAGVAIELGLDDTGQLRSLRADAGAARLADTAGVRWDEIRLTPATGASAARWQVRATLEPLAVAPLLQRAQPDIGWTGDLRMRGAFTLDAGDTFATELVLERAGGDLSIGNDTVEGGSLALGLTDLRLAITANAGTWYFTQAFAGTRLGELAGAQSVTTSAAARWPGPEAPLDGVLQGRVANLAAWGAWVPPGWRLSGALQSSASFGGRFGAPEVTGTLVGNRLGARQVLQGIAITDGELRVALEGDRARIETLRLRAGEGTLRVEGGATLGAEPRADLRVVAERFRVLGRVDRRLVVSGDAQLGLTREALQLKGAVAVDEGLIDFSRGDAPSLDGDVDVLRAGQAPRGEDLGPQAPPGPLRNADVALSVDLGQRLRLVGRGLETVLRGELQFSLPGGRPELRGSVRAESGQYAAYGQKLDITRGEVVFTGAPDNPRLDILAVRPNLDVVVGVSVTGTARSPRIRLTSEPELAEYDKLSWLVLGRAPDGLGRTDTALLQRAAVALLAGEGEGEGLTDPLLGALGLDDVSVRQTEGEVRDTILTLGKQLSRRWYLGYERSVNATTGTWQLIYRAAQRFTLRAQSGEESSLDVIWTWRWGP